jgi:hypothetical protein
VAKGLLTGGYNKNPNPVVTDKLFNVFVFQNYYYLNTS